ncbi:hypothetical protein BDV25DRAFT_144902 [Aspergillus avenaceus]|uniref:Rootletin n=1 Tax=Aspergillus avenaceus TaxID=36643 RepID=A0A5N6TFS3_ASPAV|nr:hypothetical protein BDV25DRAFT_144902 [Aspergillus avenaceus]
METEGINPAQDGPLIVSDLERDITTDEIGDDEEMLLLQMDDLTTEPISPNLSVVLGKDMDPSWTVKDAHVAPVLVQRPRSSGIDLTAFAFARPAPHGKVFSLQYSTKPPPAAPEAPCTKADVPGHKEGQSPGAADRSASNGQHSSPEDEQLGMQPVDMPPCHAEKLVATRQIAVLQDTAGNPTSSKETTFDPRQGSEICPESPNRGGGEWKKRYTTEYIAHNNQLDDSSEVSTQRPSTAISYQYKIEKSRRLNGSKCAPSKLTHKPVLENDSQLSEEDLFQLLLGRLKAREKNEVAASNLREQMEASISKLTRENESLKRELTVFDTELQKRSSESNAYRSRIEAWKTKLAKFKYLLNELGSGYKALHREAAPLKEYRLMLKKDGREIKANIAHAKEHLEQVTSVLERSQSQIRESQSLIESLQRELKRVEENAKQLKEQLSEERMRSEKLEIFVQNSSQTQSRKIDLIRRDQLNMAQKLNYTLETTERKVEACGEATQTSLKHSIDECLLSLKCMYESHLKDGSDVQQIQASLEENTSRIQSITRDMTIAIERNAGISKDAAQVLTEQSKSFGETVGVCSGLMKQLSVNGTKCSGIQESIDGLIPNVAALTTSLGEARNQEKMLSQNMEQLGRQLVEVQISAKTESTAVEKLNLELKTQQLLTAIQGAEENLKSKEDQNKVLNASLIEAIHNTQEAELVQERNRASVIARDQNRAKYEQQIHELLREKEELKKSVVKAEYALEEKQRAFDEQKASSVARLCEAERLIFEKTEEIQGLGNIRSEMDTLLSQRNAEISRLCEVQASAQKQLGEANERITGLENEVAATKEETSETSKRLQEKVESLQSDLLKKEEECARIEQDLSTENSARVSLETGKEKAKSEIHALLRRVQDSENWMRRIRDSLGLIHNALPSESETGIWKKLMTILDSAGLTSTLDTIKQVEKLDERFPLCEDVGASGSIATVSTPCRNENVEHDIVQTTELIYRTRSVQRSALSSPIKGKDIVNDGLMNVESRIFPDSQQSCDIVPFSSIRQQLSPAPCIESEQDTSDIAAMFTMAPENKGIPGQLQAPITPNKGCEAIAKPSDEPVFEVTDDTKDPPAAASRIGEEVLPSKGLSSVDEPHDSLNVTDAATTPKTVAFETHSSITGETKRKIQDSEKMEDKTSTPQTPIPGKTVRVNRRTYSRNRQTYSSKTQFESQTISSSSASHIMTQDSSRQLRSENKRARVASASHSGNQTRNPSGYFGRKTSPASLVSGSSRNSSMNGDRTGSQRWPNRGDRYSARFNKPV